MSIKQIVNPKWIEATTNTSFAAPTGKVIGKQASVVKSAERLSKEASGPVGTVRSLLNRIKQIIAGERRTGADASAKAAPRFAGLTAAAAGAESDDAVLVPVNHALNAILDSGERETDLALPAKTPRADAQAAPRFAGLTTAVDAESDAVLSPDPLGPYR